LLRGDLKQSEYQKVVLPFTVLRRLDAVLTPKKAEFLTAIEKFEGMEGKETGYVSTARRIYGHEFYNSNPLDFKRLLDDPDNLAANLKKYIAGFSPDVQEVFQKFRFANTIDDLNKKKILYPVVGRFADADLHPDTISNIEMGYLYEELIRKFSELSNETAGEHFTPREVIRLMVNLLITEDDEILTVPGKIAKIYDPAAGTGGMLSVAEDHIRSYNEDAKVAVYGQELNDETYAVARSDMMVKGQDASRITSGNSFTEDGHVGETFDYILANPPFGVDWKKYAQPIEDEHKTRGLDGHFGPGLPRKSDGSMLFLLHMISKMKPVSNGGSRIAIIFNASPLFTGSPGGGESEIRRWIVENDWLEAIVAMPEQMFYNTGIATYIWIVTNVKADERKGMVQLIDARQMWAPMRKSLGDKRRLFTDEHIAEITRIHGSFEEADESVSKVFPNHHFGFQRVTVDRPLHARWEITEESLAALEESSQWKTWMKKEPPISTTTELYGPEGTLPYWGKSWESPAEMTTALSENMGGGVPAAVIKQLVKLSQVTDPEAPMITNKKGEPEPDTDLRDTETVPLPQVDYPWVADPSSRLADDAHRNAVEEYMKEEVLPWVSEAWVDHTKTKIGYEIPFTREFYVYLPPRPIEEIDAEIEDLESEILALLEEIKK
jgi:type I restriction enzyme M protein